MYIQGSVNRTVERIRYAVLNSGFVKAQNYAEEDRDLEIIHNIQPTGGAMPYGRHIKLGDGYMACIHIYAAPESVVRNWMFSLFKRQNIITTIDIETLDNAEVEQNLNRAIDEEESRYDEARKPNERMRAETSANKLLQLLKEVNRLGNSLKALHIRIFVYGHTFNELEDNITHIEEGIKDDGFVKFGIGVDTQDLEYRSMFLPISVQQKTLNNRKGIPCPANIAAFGLPYHYVGWNDPHGFYLGDTPVTAGEGPVFFDQFHLDKYRISYDGIVFGDKGSGKSTTLKMLIEYNLITGNKVRILDVTSEYNSITKRYGGIVIKMDGSEGRLNPLEILRLEDDENLNYAKHISKLALMYKLKSPKCDDEVLDYYKTLLEELYVNFGIIIPNVSKSEQKITGLNPEAYPIYSDLLDLVDRKIELYEGIAQEKESARITIHYLMKIKVTISDIVKNYGNIFDGHTDIQNLMDADIINFDLSDVADMEPAIFDMQLFNVLSIAYDSCMTTGIEMKKLYDSRKIALEDVIHHIIYIDECAKTINSRKRFAIEKIIDIMRQDRKYFIGVWLATQNVADMFPDKNTEAAQDLKVMFGLCQYKLIFKQDEEAVSVIEFAFGKRITPNQRAMIPFFEKRDFLLNMGVNTIQLKAKMLNQSQLAYYGGGA